ncbi:hypothetical protein [Pseudescherichia sp.]|uniref:hypothetical protein n=1 Tax=Pseudescherichia sp. TaxID=2055881 RepID=UPI00289E173C|nr:hypothetical protein [Pseudescherichia sp.]
MAKYHINSIQKWDAFSWRNTSYPLTHLNAHEIIYRGNNNEFKFVVTYGLHCFAKNDTPFNIPVKYSDARESLTVCMERYEASKQLQHILPNLPSLALYQTTTEKYFTIQMMNSATQRIEPYKICVAFFKENRLLRMHILSAFFARIGPGSINQPVMTKPLSLYKIAIDTVRKPKNRKGPKEINNR